MKKNILYIIFFMVLVACKREAVFELEGYSGQILRDRTVGLRYPTAPGRQYFLSTQADSGDYFFLTGEITPGKVTFLDFGYQHLPLYVEKQHYRVVKENDNYYILSDQKESLQNRYVQYMRRIYSLDSAYNQLCRGYDTISDIGRKALLSDRLKKDLTLRNDRIIQGIKDFSGTEIALNIINEVLYFCEVDYRFFTRAVEALGDSVPEGDLKNKVVEAYEQAKKRQLTGNAPSFSLPDVNGKIHRLEDFKGKYLLIDFWASWCAPCRAKNKELNKHYRELKDMGLNVVSVSLDNDREKWLKALSEDQVSWLQLVDLEGFKKSKVRADYKVERVPAVYLIDPQGKVLITGPTLEEIYFHLQT